MYIYIYIHIHIYIYITCGGSEICLTTASPLLASSHLPVKIITAKIA